MKSVMKHQFSQVPKANIQRSQFNRSHTHKTTFDAGYLIPVYLDEALPGDTFNMQCTTFARLATPVHPIMDNMYLDVHFFAVPIRLIWENWHKFNGAQDDPGDSTDYTVPTIDMPASTGATYHDLSDYFGIPTGVANLTVNSLWHRAYNLIWNEWYRSEDIQDSVVVDKDDGPDDIADYVLLRRGKRHDYFTSCLPWPQKGDSVELPLGTSAPVDRVSSAGYWEVYTHGTDIKSTANASLNVDATGKVNDGTNSVSFDPRDGLIADLSSATASTINALREAFQLQKLYERDARGGTRYTEIVKAHFGVTSPDARLQRPEFLGGGTQYVNFHTVPVTADLGAPVGSTGAFATTSQSGVGFVKSFTEHCVILGLISARADLTYQQGLNRMFSRQTRYDFYWPALSHIGEQEVLQGEIYADGTSNDDIVFGYQERYAEYRYKPSQITGKLRSAAGTLDVWHLSQEFGAAPTLSDAFIVEDPPVDRVIDTPAEPHFILDSYFNLKCARPMPVYSVPGMIDHF